ncbi:hypothetical protein B0I35DRAFT_223120 [Stachybotrys elegans]|uniref:Uncharacterized protein n=1 Tax=Stachybotrys elegans TaxID=80388 RepID=A0A8K0SRC2_9HYPO|nr:hypothetical protein B0I35DRAFT_223120 [Stachybotrys elegans]
MTAPRKSTSSSRFWRWRSRSTKSTSDTDLRDCPNVSPVSSAPAPLSRVEQPPQPMSPFLSESAHVRSLQHPSRSSLTHASSDSMGISPNTRSLQDLTLDPGRRAGDMLATRHRGLAPPPESAAKRLYFKAKREIETKLFLKARRTETQVFETIPEDGNYSRVTVDGARSFLYAQSISKTGSWKDERGNSKRGRKLFGRAPWHRKESHDTLSSVSSSVRDIIRAGTPPATPGTDKGLSASLKSTDSQFPGGEATRIKTPLLDEDTLDSKVRGYFGGIAPPAMDGTGAGYNTMAARSMSHYGMYRQSVPVHLKEWWESSPSHPAWDDRNRDNRLFEFDVAEHLASSPSCPANSRHCDGGSGMCVYHGRNRTQSMLKSDTSARNGRYG